MTAALDRSEAAAYYHKYIDQVPPGEICAVLAVQLSDTVALLDGISEDQSLHRYGADKWSIRQVLGHVNDTERVFVFRAFWFARGFGEALPSFDQDVGVAASGAEGRSWSSHVAEFRAVRGATVSLFQGLPAEAWARRGVASGNPFSVRALAYIAAGHVAHHITILRERYLRR